MAKLKYMHLKNDMLLANFIANLIGVIFAQVSPEVSANPFPDLPSLLPDRQIRRLAA